MDIAIGQWWQRTATLAIIHYNEETKTVTCVNDFGTEIIIQESDLRALYYTLQPVGEWPMNYVKKNCSLLATDRNYEPPGPDDLKALRKKFSLTQIDVAKIVGARWTDKGSSTVAKWEVPRNKFDNRQMPYSAWRLLLLTLFIVDIEEYEREK